MNKFIFLKLKNRRKKSFIYLYEKIYTPKKGDTKITFYVIVT